MEFGYDVIYFIYQFLVSSSFLILAAIGMAIIYGMMDITNMAQGEFMMIGAYTTVLLVNRGNCPFVIAVLAGTVMTTSLGWFCDRVIIRRLYGRTMDSIVVTWGISIILQQLIYIVFGPDLAGISTPLGSFKIGQISYSIYRLLLIGVATVLVVGCFLLFRLTKFGLHSRATMQNREIASTFGVNTNRINSLTFMLGSALAGLVGSLYAPLMGITPTIGTNFLVESFVTVVVGGANPLAGTILAGTGLGLVEGTLSIFYGTFIGRIGILLIAILTIRVLPNGFSGLVEKRSMRRKRQ